MAEEEKAAEGEAKGGSKKMIIIIAVVAIIAIGASVGVTLFLLGGDDGEEAAVAEENAEPVATEALYMNMKPALIVTYNVAGKQRFLQATLSVLSRSQTALDGLELHMPVIRNRLINLYGTKSFDDLQTDEGRQALLTETRDAMNETLAEQSVEGEIEAVLFQNLVLQ